VNEVKLTLPLPPSANNLFANARAGHGRYITKAYKTWREEAGWSLKAQAWQSVIGPYELHITLPKMRKGSDIDNRAKGIIDLLAEHKVTDDDEFLRHLTIGRDDTASSVVVTVREAA
jgi:Holliday junction resolvase RusA-like endonuclease